MLFEPIERERRFNIVRKGVKEDFWKVVTESLQSRNMDDMNEVIRLHARGRKDEAERLSLIVQARQDVMKEPYFIIESNKSLFEKYVIEPCKACGTVLKRLKEKANATHN